MAKLYGKGTITEIVKGKKYRIALSGGKNPVADGYLRHQETFLGTKRDAKERIYDIRRELELLRDCLKSGLNPDELAAYGLAIETAAKRGMSADDVSKELKRLKEEESKRVAFADWCEKYLNMREGLGKYRPSTLKGDRSRSKHLINGLGNVLVADITPSIVNDLYINLRADGVGETCILQAHKLLKRVLAYAVDNDIITRNPCDRVSTPKKPKPRRNALAIDEAQKLGAICASGTPTANKTAVYLGLSLGARLGEVLGLEWQHVSLDGARPYVHIIQQFTAQGEPAPLKTDSDDNPVGRVVPLDTSTVNLLKAWKAEQREQLNSVGVEPGTSTPIVTNTFGGFTDHSNFQRWWRDFCVANGFGKLVTPDGKAVKELIVGDDASLYPDCFIEWRDSDGWPCDESGKRYSRTYKRPKIKRHYEGLHFHELRHTHFTMRLAAGMDIPTAQALGGWSTPTVLMNVYVHATPENVWAAAGFMDSLAEKQFA